MGVLQVLERTPTLGGTPPEVLERMASLANTRSLSRGEQLWKAGDQPRAMVVIRSGLIKVVRSAPKGRSAICGLFGAPETVGDVALLKDVPYPADAVVVTDSASIIWIPKALVLEAMQKNPELGVSIACGMHSKMSALHDKIDVLSAGSVEARLATLLIKLYDQFGDDFDDGTSKVPVALSRRELADLVSTSFETAIRVMTRWEREGVVDTGDQGFTVRNLHALQKIAGTAVGERRPAEV